MLRTVGEESVLLNLKSGLYFGADAVATHMWTTLTGSESIQAAFDSLLAEYEVNGSELRRDLEEFLNKLLEYGLIEIKRSSATSSEKAV
jgi:hypothetical protein